MENIHKLTNNNYENCSLFFRWIPSGFLSVFFSSVMYSNMNEDVRNHFITTKLFLMPNIGGIFELKFINNSKAGKKLYSRIHCREHLKLHKYLMSNRSPHEQLYGYLIENCNYHDWKLISMWIICGSTLSRQPIVSSLSRYLAITFYKICTSYACKQ